MPIQTKIEIPKTLLAAEPLIKTRIACHACGKLINKDEVGHRIGYNTDDNISVEAADISYTDLYRQRNEVEKLLESAVKNGDESQAEILEEQIARSRSGAEIEIGRQYNDSESFAIELAIELDGKCDGVEQITGNIAFVCLQTDKQTHKATQLFWGRNYGSPLKMQKDQWHFLLSSEGGRVQMSKSIRSTGMTTRQIPSMKSLSAWA